ncbi:hypothetical protein ALC62_02798 [Cyphomyrmex costatus]|uniref:Uncharacterized protein n=1 Tax=Cyphomyrmex costatus TaxID=456900 RepID=A0A151IMY0_9HYME|nr:hypothetical protein ALC62_02798 [Cyphomyrmex costatus]
MPPHSLLLHSRSFRPLRNTFRSIDFAVDTQAVGREGRESDGRGERKAKGGRGSKRERKRGCKETETESVHSLDDDEEEASCIPLPTSSLVYPPMLLSLLIREAISFSIYSYPKRAANYEPSDFSTTYDIHPRTEAHGEKEGTGCNERKGGEISRRKLSATIVRHGLSVRRGRKMKYEMKRQGGVGGPRGGADETRAPRTAKGCKRTKEEEEEREREREKIGAQRLLLVHASKKRT